jgi:ubiquinone/menaquinone biosynthesis C-methylase UbiE
MWLGTHMTSSLQQAYSAKAGAYYDKLQWFYNVLARAAGGPNSLHFGLWWDDTHSIAEALTNGDEVIAQKLALTRDDVVLDAGCGVGASSIYLAQQHGCRVTGITVSSVQVRQANEHARRAGVDHLVSFKLMDFTCMDFADATFTKAFTQESANYAVDKLDLLKELFRVLSPGGRYVSLDVHLKRDVRPGSEQTRYAQVMDGWGALAHERFDRFQELAAQAGFSITESGDIHRYTLKSSRLIWRQHLFSYGLVQLCYVLRMTGAELVRHHKASIAQKRLLCDEDNLITFGYLVADK